MRMRNSAAFLLATLCAGASLVACDSGSEEPTASGVSRKVMTPEAAKIAANMVTAVSAGETKGLVDVKFELTQRPEVGKPTDISLVFIPAGPLDRLSARFSVPEGLELLKGEQTEQFARPVMGAAITHTVTILPKRDGIFYVQAIVLTDSETESVSRSFAIPLIAGSGIAEWSPKKVAARGNDAS